MELGQLRKGGLLERWAKAKAVSGPCPSDLFACSDGFTGQPRLGIRHSNCTARQSSFYLDNRAQAGKYTQTIWGEAIMGIRLATVHSMRLLTPCPLAVCLDLWFSTYAIIGVCAAFSLIKAPCKVVTLLSCDSVCNYTLAALRPLNFVIWITTDREVIVTIRLPCLSPLLFDQRMPAWAPNAFTLGRQRSRVSLPAEVVSGQYCTKLLLSCIKNAPISLARSSRSSVSSCATGPVPCLPRIV